MSHGRTVCTCGALISQCRCPNHNNVSIVPAGCKTCKAKELNAQDTFYTEKGLPWASRIWDALRPIVEGMEAEGASGSDIEAFISRTAKGLVYRDPMRPFRKD